MGVQFNAFVFIGVVFASVVQSLLATERTVYYRERAANMYRPFLFNIAAGTSFCPFFFFSDIPLDPYPALESRSGCAKADPPSPMVTA